MVKEFGFVRVAACVPETAVANISANTNRIIDMIGEAASKGAHAAIFPELSLTAYTCADLFGQRLLIEQAEDAIRIITEKTRNIPILSVVGLPVEFDNRLFNAACVICSGEVLGLCVKTYVPESSEYYDKRWFSPGSGITGGETGFAGARVLIGNDLIFRNRMFGDMAFSVEICEDLWAPIPPSTFHAMGGAHMIFNLSASNELIGKAEYRKELVASHSAKTITGYVYVSAGTGESTTDTVFGGHSIICEYGQVISESERFRTGPHITYGEIDLQRLKNDRYKSKSFMEYAGRKSVRQVEYSLQISDLKEMTRIYSAHPFVPDKKETLETRCREIFNIQSLGLYKRMKHTGCRRAVIGISGGLDSTLALLVTEKTFLKLGLPRENIIAVTMPGFGTSDQTFRNARELIRLTGADKRNISIKNACRKQLKDIGHDTASHDVVFENVQARERTMLLMNLANKEGAMVVGTGDLSEIALGWSTYNGDHMSMYAVNAGVPKTLVKFLINWIAENEADTKKEKLLKKIAATPISPELLPPDSNGNISQKTEDVIGPYELHDFFLYHMLRFGSTPAKILFLAKRSFTDIYCEDEIKRWLRVFYQRFFQNQYKRSCMPDGPKVGTIALSPRADLKMPSDAEADAWIGAVEGADEGDTFTSQTD